MDKIALLISCILEMTKLNCDKIREDDPTKDG